MSASPFVILLSSDFLAKHPHLSHQAKGLETAYSLHHKIDDSYLQTVGEALWQALDSDTQAQLKACKQLAGLHVLPIIIESNDAAVMQLP